MAQFMVQNNLTAKDVEERADELSFPQSVIDMMRGLIGYPPGGFPEPLRSQVTFLRTIYATLFRWDVEMPSYFLT